MRIYANINERTVRRKFTEPKHRKRPLTIIDHSLPAFSLRIVADDTRTFLVRVKRRLNVDTLRLGTAAELTPDEARAMAVAEIEAAEAECRTGPLFRYFADEFMRRQGPRWKPATRASNRSALRNHILPFFGGMRVADIARADVRRWFDSMSGAPGTANRALPVLSVMMTRAELWERRARPVTVTLKAVRELRPARTEIIVCTGLRTRGGQQLAVALGVQESEVRRMLDPCHATKIGAGWRRPWPISESAWWSPLRPLPDRRAAPVTPRRVDFSTTIPSIGA